MNARLELTQRGCDVVDPYAPLHQPCGEATGGVVQTSMDDIEIGPEDGGDLDRIQVVPVGMLQDAPVALA